MAETSRYFRAAVGHTCYVFGVCIRGCPAPSSGGTSICSVCSFRADYIRDLNVLTTKRP